jgi:hypothetical protein
MNGARAARTPAALGLAACALAACGSQASTAAPGATSSVACASSQLKIGLTHTGALGGQAGGYLEFTNSGSTSCRLTGWPTVRGLTTAGQGSAFGRAHSTMFGAWQYHAPVPVLTLQPGQSAYAVAVGDDHPAGSATNCPAPYQRLSVTPPGAQRSVVISGWLPGATSYFPSCLSIHSTSTDQVSVVVPLASLPH